MKIITINGQSIEEILAQHHISIDIRQCYFLRPPDIDYFEVTMRSSSLVCYAPVSIITDYFIELERQDDYDRRNELDCAYGPKILE